MEKLCFLSFCQQENTHGMRTKVNAILLFLCVNVLEQIFTTSHTYILKKYCELTTTYYTYKQSVIQLNVIRHKSKFTTSSAPINLELHLPPTELTMQKKQSGLKINSLENPVSFQESLFKMAAVTNFRTIALRLGSKARTTPMLVSLNLR